MPERAFDETNLQALLQELTTDFTERDTLLNLWDALILRENGRERETGQYVPPPFDKSKTIIKHATGIIVDRAQFVAAKAAENAPNIKVFTISDGEDADPTQQAMKRARKQELCLNGIFWSADRRSRGSIQRRVAWSAVTKGVGWYHSYRAQDGWKIPDRRFFKDPSDEELDRLREDDVGITDAFIEAPEEGMTHAESLDHLSKRSSDGRKQAAVDGEQLYVIENPAPGVVYWREDTDGISLAAIIEEVPKSVIGDEWGVIEQDGNIIAGRQQGGSPGQIGMQTGSWTLARVWTRTEFYYYISSGTGNSFSGNGNIVAHGFHKYGEVPLWPISATETDSPKPAKRYLPAIYGALAIIPAFNQMMTLLSNAAVYNTTPRYVIIKPDGTPVIDDATGESVTFASDTTVGLSPEFVSIINGGGTFEQLKIENVDDLVKLMEFYSVQLDTTLPSEAALGSSGASEPAWGTRLKQAAQAIKVQPLVDSHASGVERMASMWSRDIRLSSLPVYIKTKPGKRGETRNVRGLIELNPDDIVLDIGVDQDKRSLDERLQLMQIGLELLAARRIDPIRYEEEFAGADDPRGNVLSALAWQGIEQLLPIMLQQVIMKVQGQLLPTPNEIQAEAELGAAVENNGLNATPTGEPAEAAGVRFPGQEMGLAGPADQAGITTNIGGARAGPAR